MKIERVIKESIGTTAKDIEVHGLSFLIQNNSEGTAVYFKDKDFDGKAVTANTGFKLAAGKSTVFPMEARTLSVIASDASTDVRVLILDC